MIDFASLYLDEMKRQFRGHKRMGEAAISQLEDKDFFMIVHLTHHATKISAAVTGSGNAL